MVTPHRLDKLEERLQASRDKVNPEYTPFERARALASMAGKLRAEGDIEIDPDRLPPAPFCADTFVRVLAKHGVEGLIKTYVPSLRGSEYNAPV